MICSGLSLISEHLLVPFTWIPQEALLWWRPLKVFPSLYQQFLHCASHSQCYRTHIPVWVVISNLLTVLVWIYFKTQVSILGNIFFSQLVLTLHWAGLCCWSLAAAAHFGSAESFTHFGQQHILESLNYGFSVHITMMYNKLDIKFRAWTCFIYLFWSLN